MNRLQKKCFLASAGMHLLLALILLLGSAFGPRDAKLEEIQLIDFTPTLVNDRNLAGGGDPKAGSAPAPRPPTPTPLRAAAPAAPPQAKPEPKSKAADEEPAPKKQEKTEADSFDTVAKKTKRIQINTKLVTKRVAEPKSGPSKAELAKAREARERRAAEERRAALAAEFAQAASSLGSAGSGPTRVVVGDHGPGGGGPSYAGYSSLVQHVYMEAWAPPDDPSKDSAVAEARITIRRDGSVEDYKLVKRSGDQSVDASVQKALERVHNIGHPFPEGSKDSKRTYILQFDLKAKRGLA